MSKYAVILLLVFISGTILLEPVIVRGLTQPRLISNENLVFDYESAIPANHIFGGDSFLANSFLPSSADKRGFMQMIEVDQRGSQKSKPLTLKAFITAYSSSADETKEENQVITASGRYVHFGVAAANFLPLGSRIRLPEIFGGQIFIIEDRMNKRYNDRIDIWMPSKGEALDFGVKMSEIEIL